MNLRFLTMTVASCTIVFAMIFALTAPVTPPAPVAPATPAVMYADCDAVRAAGAAPLRADQPGYRPALDGNMNGVACEPVGQAAQATGPTEAGEVDNSPAPVPASTAPVAPPRMVDPDAPLGAVPPSLEVQM